MNEPRVYKHSPFQFVVLILMFGFILVAMFFNMDLGDGSMLIPVAILLLVVIISITSLTQKTIISEDEISSQSLLGTKTLRWSEINRVSGRGYSIKLHNLDGDITVVPSPNLPGYEEVVESIGNKRPDLFNPREYDELKSGSFPLLAGLIFTVLFVGMFVGFGLLLYNSPDAAPVMIAPLIIFLVIIAVFVGMMFFRPRSLVFDGRSMSIKYFLSEKTLLADEIQSVQFTFQRSRNGKIYFVLLHLVNRKSVRISGLNPSLPVVYLVLKNWHKQNK
ncbi:hypothetical protein [Candidatus Villigracilis affinis]|uniref:hypothetical protein n=1 Tax=Candidatus Villigracilis affinis TaxID=3140682 RepID=UPI002A1B0F30|nr:hypothetical protein [Anaerolineales bacterium]